VQATAPDGTIEAVAMPDAPGFVLGLQWHPEWSYAANPHSLAIFRAFGDACRTSKSRGG
jgi:putative glutamine amidotransferase